MRVIDNTEEEAQHPWPEDIFIQGGAYGLVLTPEGQRNYTTAFFEAFPPGTFLRGEGKTVAEAEDKCWERYQLYLSCPHDQGFRRGSYRNGCGHCNICGMWFNKDVTGLEELPPDPDAQQSFMERAFRQLYMRDS